jgi:hypothetical protein
MTEVLNDEDGGARPSVPAVPAEIIPPFDYTQLEPEIADKLRQTAQRVRAHKSACVLEVGGELLQVKDQLEHGDWGKWLERECELKERTAQRMMNAAKWMRDKSVTVTDLPTGILYMLTAPSTPPEIGDTVLSRWTNGEHIPPEEVAEMLKAARPAKSEGRRRAQRRAEEDREAAEQELISLLTPLSFVDRVIELLEALGYPLAAPLRESWANITRKSAVEADCRAAAPEPSTTLTEEGSVDELVPVASPDHAPVATIEGNEQPTLSVEGAAAPADLPSGISSLTVVTAAATHPDQNPDAPDLSPVPRPSYLSVVQAPPPPPEPGATSVPPEPSPPAERPVGLMTVWEAVAQGHKQSTSRWCHGDARAHPEDDPPAEVPKVFVDQWVKATEPEKKAFLHELHRLENPRWYLPRPQNRSAEGHPAAVADGATPTANAA